MNNDNPIFDNQLIKPCNTDLFNKLYYIVYDLHKYFNNKEWLEQTNKKINIIKNNNFSIDSVE